ncbi:YheC/YheD family protein [Melghirimyces profundicolus]|uniref:YheC/YheD family protein n=1 Tax=Melghirimyces profundicolus TaxID=1242148 RepID=UPI003CCB8177
MTLKLRGSTQGLKLLERHPVVFIKPAIGSLGKGISQIQSKGEKGEWQISGETAKVAQRKRNLTNLSQNGKAVPAPTVLSHAFPNKNSRIILGSGD